MEVYLLRLTLAGIVGFMLGILSNRQDKTKSARVFGIVTASSALLYIVATGLYEETPGVGDPTRLTAQILSALGFLFAGMIYVNQDKSVEGITTAAALLLSAVLGVLIAAGYFWNVIWGIIFFIIIYWISGFVGKSQIGKRKRNKTGEEIPPG